MGYIDLAEQCIRCAEKISEVDPRHILKSSISLQAVNMIDFFDTTTQQMIFKLMTNICGVSESESDFQVNLLPVIPSICYLVQNYSDKSKVEKLTSILLKLALSFAQFSLDTSSLFE